MREPVLETQSKTSLLQQFGEQDDLFSVPSSFHGIFKSKANDTLSELEASVGSCHNMPPKDNGDVLAADNIATSENSCKYYATF